MMLKKKEADVNMKIKQLFVVVRHDTKFMIKYLSTSSSCAIIRRSLNKSVYRKALEKGNKRRLGELAVHKCAAIDSGMFLSVSCDSLYFMVIFLQECSFI